MNIVEIFESALAAKYALNKDFTNLAVKIATTGDNQNAQKIADLSIKLNAITNPFTGALGALHIKDMFAMTLDAKNELHQEMMRLAIEFAKEQKSYASDVETLASKLVEITNPLVG